ncbi:MAG: PAS domain S-box protein, partial [Planctomycetota bacterium]
MDAVSFLIRFDEAMLDLASPQPIGRALHYLKKKYRLTHLLLALLDEERGGFHCREEQYDIPGFGLPEFIPFRETSLLRVIRERKAFYRADLRRMKNKTPTAERLIAAGILSTFTVPLMVGERGLGILSVGSGEADGIPERVRQIVMLVAPRLAQVMENVRLFERLAESEEKYRSVVADQADMAIRIAPDGRILFANRSFCLTFDRTEEEALKENFYSFLREDDCEILKRAIENFSPHPVNITVDQHAVTRNHPKEQIYQWLFSHALDERKNLVSLVGTGRNLTYRRWLERMLRIKNYAINSFISPSVLVDLDGTILHVNNALLRLGGYSDDSEILGRPVTILWRDPEAILAVQEAALREGRWTGELIGRKKDDALFEAEIQANAVSDERGRIIVWYLSYQDITARKNAERSVEKQRNLFRAVADFSERIASLDFDHAIRQAVEFIEEGLNLPDVSVAFPDEAGGGFRYADATPGIEGMGRGDRVPFHATMMGRVFPTRKALYRPDIGREEPHAANDARLLAAGIRSSFIVPMNVGEKCLGCLNVGARAVDGISEEKRQAVTLLAQRLGQVVENARLFNEALAAREEALREQEILRFLAEFGEKVRYLSPERVVEQARDFIVSRLGIERVSIFLREEKREGLTYLDSWPELPGIEKGAFLSFAETSLSDLVRSKKHRYLPDLRLFRGGYDTNKKLIALGFLCYFSVP